MCGFGVIAFIRWIQYIFPALSSLFLIQFELFTSFSIKFVFFHFPLLLRCLTKTALFRLVSGALPSLIYSFLTRSCHRVTIYSYLYMQYSPFATGPFGTVIWLSHSCRHNFLARLSRAIIDSHAIDNFAKSNWISLDSLNALRARVSVESNINI